jgi:hypothetical protein
MTPAQFYFIYGGVQPPVITSVSPNFSVAGGGVGTIVITGSNFTGATVYSVGGVQLTGVTITPTTITGTAGAGSPGLGNVVVTTPGGTTTFVNGFWYLPTLDLLCVADLGVTVATGVSQWNDFSGNSRHLVQATGSKQPSLISSGLNSLNTIRWNGSSHFMTSPSYSRALGWYYWIVLKQVAYNASGYVVANNDGTGNNAAVYNVGPTPKVGLYNNLDGPNVSPTVGTFYAMKCHFASGAGASDMTLNANSPVTGTISTGSITSGLIVGALSSTTDFGSLELAAILSGPTDDASIQSFLKNRWNIY